MSKDWSLAYSTREMYLAELAKRMLADNGIEAVIMDKMDAAYKNFGDIEVYVHYSKVLKAKKLIEDFEKTE